MVSAQLSLFPSLDNSCQSVPSLRWGKKVRRGYMRCRAGVERADFMKRRLFFLTLTSASVERGLNCLKADFSAFVKRVRRDLLIKFDFFRVFTSEGFGVVHLIFEVGKFDLLLCDGWSYDALHAYFSCLWMELHGAPNVWVRACYRVHGSFNCLVRYLVGQYIFGQSYLTMGYSGGWCFRGFVKHFYRLIKTRGFTEGLLAFRNLLMSDFEFVRSFDLVIGV